MDPSNPFMQQASSYRPLSTGDTQSPYNDFSSITGGGGIGMMGNMLLNSLASQQLARMGMVPGQFNPTMNWTDQMRNMQLMQSQMEAARIASSSDRFRDIRLAQNVLLGMGAGNTPETARMAQTLGGGLTNFSNMASLAFPGMMDQMGGIQGRASVMAQQMMLGGRYQIDPGNQYGGYSAATAGNLASGIFNQLYGNPAAIRQMKGVSAGQAGEMYSEMSRRGMVGSVDQLDFGVADGEIASPKTQEMMRADSIRKISAKLKDMAGAVSAMKEVMGPGAPMETIMNGLEIITQGRLANMGGTAAERIVRSMQSVSVQTGISFENLTNMTAQNAGMAKQMGLDPIFGIHATTQSALFRQAYGQAGANGGFGGDTADSFADSRARRQLGGSGSLAASNLAAIVSMSENGLFRRGSQGEAVAEALKAGKKTVNIGGREVNVGSFGLSREAIYDLASKSGIQNAGTVTTFLGARKALQETISDYKLGDYAVPMQAREVAKYQDAVLAGQAGVAGLSGGDKQAAAIAMQRILAGVPDGLNPAARNDYIVDQLRKSGITGLNQGRLLEMAAAGGIQLDNIHRNNTLFGPNLQSVKNRYFNPTIDRHAAANETAAVRDSAARNKAAGMNSGTPVRRGISAIQDGQSLEQAFARAAGANENPEDPRIGWNDADAAAARKAQAISEFEKHHGVNNLITQKRGTTGELMSPAIDPKAPKSGGSAAAGNMTLTGTLTLLGDGKVGISATTNNQGSVPTAVP